MDFVRPLGELSFDGRVGVVDHLRVGQLNVVVLQNQNSACARLALPRRELWELPGASLPEPRLALFGPP